MNTDEPLNIVIACGGTGGHLFPGIAVAESLRRHGHRPVLLISQKSVDAQASDKYKDLDFRTVEAIAMPRLLSVKMIPFVWKLLKTRAACRQILKELNADVVLGMGGFTSLPPVQVAHSMGMRTYVHDSNALPGKSNRLTARWCNAVLLGMQEASHYFPNSRCLVTGTPVREELETPVDRATARRTFDLDPDRPVILTMGGSQGARQINTIVAETAARESGVQFLLLAGRTDYDRVAEMTADLPHVRTLPFCADMASAYAAADAVIARSGASSLTELAALGKASLLIPYPFAADDHQTHNARVYSAQGAARMLRQDELTSDTLMSFIREIVLNPVALNHMEQAAHARAGRDAAARIAYVLENDTLPKEL